MGHPSAADLVEAVQAFLKQAEASLAGREAFHAKVAGNALGIVMRELRQQPDGVERAELAALLGHDGELPALRSELCGGLRVGTLTEATPGLLDALIIATRTKLAVDNPRYATLDRLGAPL